MDSSKPVYITTTLPYVNSAPHVGFAMEISRADAMARFYKLMGHEVFFNTGTDEHGQKIFDKAAEAGVETQSYVDSWAEKFRNLKSVLNLSEDIHFIRTTDPDHIKAAQAMWEKCDQAGYIYKKNYQAKYCVGCELEKTDSELEDGRCPIHPNRQMQTVNEENYFFKFSAFGEQLLEYYKTNPVVPGFRQNEIVAFVERGLQDFSISRLKEKMSWGVPVPNDPEHVMYVWFDALTNYVSTLGWPSDTEGDFEKFWQNGFTIQYAGKDNLRQQSAMWQAMLLAAGIKHTDKIIINGFINSGGQKMSKSLGNVLDPYDITDKYGSEALRYYLLRHMNNHEDSDMTMEKFHEAYTAHLVNGVGNLTSRIMKLAETNLENLPETSDQSLPKEWITLMENFDIKGAMDLVWQEIQDMDNTIATDEPYRVVKTDLDTGRQMISALVVRLYGVGRMLAPFMPETSASIKAAVKSMKKPETPLFGRVSAE